MGSIDSMSFRPLPITILSGFLGAGKTTLLQHLLAAQDESRVIVLENELGEIAVDDELLCEGHAARVDVVLGRTCCETRQAFVQQLYAIAAVADSFDRLIIETTGVAHPGILAQIILSDSALRRCFRLDGIITVVDAANFVRHVDADGHATEQLAYADAVVVNKSDLVAPEAVDSLLGVLRWINGHARYFVTAHGRAPAEELLALRGFDLDRIERGVEGCERGGGTGAASTSEEHAAEPDKKHEIGTVAITVHGALDADRFRVWIEDFVVARAADLFRSKGVVALHRMPERLLFQGVHGNFSASRGRPWGTEARTSRLVFIGRNLDRTAIERAIASCRATEAAVESHASNEVRMSAS